MNFNLEREKEKLDQLVEKHDEAIYDLHDKGCKRKNKHELVNTLFEDISKQTRIIELLEEIENISNSLESDV